MRKRQRSPYDREEEAKRLRQRRAEDIELRKHAAGPARRRSIPSLRRRTGQFQRAFLGNPFKDSCNVCDRSWFTDPTPEQSKQLSVLVQTFPCKEVCGFQVCATCRPPSQTA
ncbi:hypothetical protein HPB47_011346 [Ixodes persulcatus]|uniref:Uncharacterized protein n=1 Tax=Ixodes persulcatus TaxID=34615 RepID=A0AC60NWI0_IXOPE|nr:hypothetical protein HPB47_011346 [Ixodes persulcatus]